MIDTLSIVIPAYNEGRTIHFILDKIKNVELANLVNKEIIFVNDCSTDYTEQAIEKYMLENREMNIQYFKHEINLGKGSALHKGIKKAHKLQDT